MKEATCINQLYSFKTGGSEGTGEIDFLLKDSRQRFQMDVFRNERGEYQSGVLVFHASGDVDCPICGTYEEDQKDTTLCEDFISDSTLKQGVIADLRLFPQGRLRFLHSNKPMPAGKDEIR